MRISVELDMATSRGKYLNGVAQSGKQSCPDLAAYDDPKTELKRWRLLDDHGRQTWHYLTSDEEEKAWPQTTADKYFLEIPTVCLFVPCNFRLTG